jgi:hypothetical protein
MLEGGNPYRAFRAVKEYAGKAMTSRFARDVISTVRDFPFDAILADGLPGIPIGAQATGRPMAALVAQTYVRPTPGLPLLGTGWSPGHSFLGKARDKLAPRMASWLLSPTVPRLNAVVERYEQLPLDNFFELFDRCSRVLVMTSPSFDFSAPQLPGNVIYVGPQLDDPDWAADTEWQQQASEPLVLVATSSIYQDQVDLLQRVGQALSQLPVRAVLTTGRAVDPEDIQAGPNVQVLEAAPAHASTTRSLRRRHTRWAWHRAEVPRGWRAAGVRTDGSRPERQHRTRASARCWRTPRQGINAHSDCSSHLRSSGTPPIHRSRTPVCRGSCLGSGASPTRCRRS